MIGLAPAHVPAVAVSVWPCWIVPVIDGSAVMKATAAWKEMEKRSIKRGDPEYDLYKNRAEKEARVAIDRIAKNQKPPYDLIGEIGAIVIKGGVVPNLTDDVLQELGS